jgi:predicted nucleotide-binding protein
MLPSNQAPSPSQPSPPTVVRLRRLLERATRLLQQRSLTGINRNQWIIAVRNELALIYGYGRDVEQLGHFGRIPNDLTDDQFRATLSDRIEHLRRFIENLEALLEATKTPLLGKRIFIGHGRSPLWRELKDLIFERLGLPWVEFNREAVAGLTTSERLQAMLSEAGFAFLVMTGEEERLDATLHARENVIHEVGLFQGHLGPRRAVVMLEDGCAEFSNITGLSQIRFPRDDISARFEEVRRVLEREGLI